MHSIVAIDIETTGLDENRDSIIEIAAVKFKGSRIEDEWSSLINPNRHIPEFITGLTGIDDAMVRQAPVCARSPVPWKPSSAMRRLSVTMSVLTLAFYKSKFLSHLMK